MGVLTELCQELRNWFDRDQKKWIGQLSIENHKILLSGAEINLIEGQYFRIIGSLLNDGVHVYPDEDLKEESFNGAVWSMAIPPSVIELANTIDAYNEKNAEAIDKPYQSESFGGYSYTKGSGKTSGGSGGNPAHWKNHFADDLNRWRKL